MPRPPPPPPPPFERRRYGGPFEMEVVMMNIYYFVRCVAIAAKYAFMGDGSYKQFQRMSSHAANELQLRAQFIPGWTNPSAEVLHVRSSTCLCQCNDALPVWRPHRHGAQRVALHATLSTGGNAGRCGAGTR